MSGRPALVEQRPFEPLPAAVLVDTSVLGGIGATSPDRDAFIEYVTTTDTRVYLSEYVVEELQTEPADAYGINGWLGVVDRADWLEALPSPDPGLQIHDAQKAGGLMDRAHERLAGLENRDEHEVPRTDAAFAGHFVQLLGGFDYETVGLIIDDRNAEAALSAVVSGTYYEEFVRIFRGDDVLELMHEEYESV